MKIVSYNKIAHSIRRINDLTGSGISYLYGRGTESVVITASSLLPGQTLANYLRTNYGAPLSFEFKDLTIGAGVNLRVTDEAQVAYIRVNGTLIVNGHLHMDGAGGQFFPRTDAGDITVENNYTVHSSTNTNITFSEYNPGIVGDTSSCTTTMWNNLTNYGAQETFFDGSTSLTGAGGCGFTNYKYTYTTIGENGQACESPWDDETYPKINPHCTKSMGDGSRNWGKWETSWGITRWVFYSGKQQVYKQKVADNTGEIPHDYYEVRGSRSKSVLSGGGNMFALNLESNPVPEGGYISAGAGGGMIALYSGAYVNNGTKWVEGESVYDLNIHANGGNEISVNTPQNGGGSLIISARRIVVGPHGSITADGGNGQGLMTLLNRPPYTGLYTYNNGSPSVYTNTFSGGAGYAQFFQR